MTTKIKTPYAKYACIAGESKASGARCRNEARHSIVPGETIENQRCEEHQDAELFPSAARPTRVIVDLHLSERFMNPELINILDREMHVSASRHPRGRHGIITRAETAGRDPFEYTKNLPADGAEVFCGNGAMLVAPAQLLEELYANMGMASVKLWKKPGSKGGCILRIEFSATTPKSDIPFGYPKNHKYISYLMKMAWQKTHIYCNLPWERGVLHTVKLTGPMPNTAPRGTLRFAGGDWAIDPI